MEWTALKNRSTTDRMVVLLTDGGSLVTKSMGGCDHGHLGMGSGCRRLEVEVFFGAQTEQAVTNPRHPGRSWATRTAF